MSPIGKKWKLRNYRRYYFHDLEFNYCLIDANSGDNVVTKERSGCFHTGEGGGVAGAVVVKYNSP